MITRPAGLDTRRLAPTGLAELNAAAGLLVRVDRKYLVPLTTAQGLVDALTGAARVLQIEGRRGFSYASTYFDTPDLDSYLLAAHKRRRRFKIRTRSYLDSGSCFLEVKTRGPRGATVKRRVQCPPLDAGRLTPSGRDFIASRLADDVAPPERARRLAQALEPVLITRYERATLHLPEESARLTLDTRLAWIGLPPRGAPAVGRTGSADGQGGRTGDSGDADGRTGDSRDADGRTGDSGAGGRHIPVRAAGALAIVETKTPAAPSAADRWLWAAGHRPAVISKYATGMALLHPELPANKWHHILTHELAAA